MLEETHHIVRGDLVHVAVERLRELPQPVRQVTTINIAHTFERFLVDHFSGRFRHALALNSPVMPGIKLRCLTDQGRAIQSVFSLFVLVCDGIQRNTEFLQNVQRCRIDLTIMARKP